MEPKSRVKKAAVKSNMLCAENGNSGIPNIAAAAYKPFKADIDNP